MADDINLPNLVSHLAVNLGNVSGTIADASRQGSSMGAALGRGVNRELGDLLRNLPQVQIDGDSDPLDRDLARVHQQLAQLDAQRIGVDISMPDALRELNRLQAQLQRIGDEHPNVNVQASTRQAAARLDELLAAARHVDDTDVDIDVHVDEDRPNRLLGVLGRLGRAGSGAGLAIAGGMAKAGAALGTVIPLAASVVSLLENVAPAAGVAVTGLIAVQLASGAVKLAAVGMSDALSAALDPAKAEDYAKALEKLSPEARKFAEAVHEAAPALHELQQGVQDKVFDGLDKSLERTGRVVLPTFRRELLATGTTLNSVGKSVLSAVQGLGESGTLGRALSFANKGLRNLSGVPGVVVTALGQIGAAAGPSFDKLTSVAGKAANTVGERLDKAFKSGGLEDAIETAIGLLGDLVDVGVNVGKILGSVFGAAQASGGGLVNTLKDVTGAIAEAVASPEVQAGLSALFGTMSVLAKTVAPLLGLALKAVAPVLTALGPPVQTLIKSLGDGLSPIIVALGPVLVAAADAVGALVEAIAPLLPVAGQLIASLLPAVTPLFAALQVVFEAMAPVVAELATILQDTLTPILDELPGIVKPFADMIGMMAVTSMPVLLDMLVQLAPTFVQLGQSFADLLEASAPLIETFATLNFVSMAGFLQAATPVINLVLKLAAYLASDLARAINEVAIPALEAIAALMQGDFDKAADRAGDAVSGLVSRTVAFFTGLPTRAAAALIPLGVRLVTAMSTAGAMLIGEAGRRVAMAVAAVATLPARAQASLGGLGGRLVAAGAALIDGFIAGITRRIPSVRSVLGSLTSSLADWKGPRQKDAKILTPAGKLLIEGFIKGIDGTTAQLKAKLQSITKALPDNVKSGYGKTLTKAIAQLEKLVAKHDSVVKKLATAQKKLDDLVKARNKAASDITSGILDEANITSGHADVNSVSAITVGLQQALKATTAFQANIAKLKKSGLRSDLLQQIADAGVEAGGATAAALAKATPAELKRINDLQAQLSKSATSTGNTVGDALYGAGIKAAQGLVDGLKSQEKAIENQMKKIAENMLKTVKKTHKTHSPSRAFHDIGVMDGEGLRQGLRSMAGKVGDAARTMAGAALDVTANSFPATPSAAQLASVYAGGGSRDQTNHFHLYGSDATPGGILRALSWQGLVGRR